MIQQRFRRLLCASLCAWSVSALAGHAGADDQSVPLKAQARALFEDAKTLVGQSRHAEACPKFEESQRLDPGIGTKFYLADCLEHVGRYASAWVLYLEVADEAGDAKMKDREQYAKKRAEVLAPKLTRMVVVLADDVKSIPGIEVRRDGVVLKSGQWGTALPVDAGKHTISVGAPSKRTWETTVEASGEGATITVTIPGLRDDAEAVAAASASGSASPVGSASAAPSGTAGPLASSSGQAIGQPPPPVEGGWSTQRKVAVGLGAAGVAGLIVGGIFGGLAMGKAGDAKNLCTAGVGGGPDHCTPDGGKALEDANSLANVANVGFIGGGALAAAGVVLWLVAPATEKAAASSGGRPTRVGVTAGPHGAVFQLGREW